MANEKRLRANNVGGLVEDNPLTSGATTLTTAGLAALPVVDSTNHAVIVIDPDGLESAPEIVYVTAHTGGATTATIVRGAEGSVAVAHSVDIPWIHTATVKDFDGAGGGSGLIGIKFYDPNTTSNYSTTSTTFADIDATNLAVAFTAPPSGSVLVRLNAVVGIAANTSLAWGLRDGTSDIGAAQAGYNGYQARIAMPFLITGLTPGAAKTFKWSHARTYGSGTVTTAVGGGAGVITADRAGQASMEVWAVNC